LQGGMKSMCGYLESRIASQWPLHNLLSTRTLKP
jgi:hypothetical protein